MTQLSSSILPTDDTGDLASGTPNTRSFWSTWRDAINTLLHSTTNPTEDPAGIIDEVVEARNGEASLNDYLDSLVALITASGDAVDIPADFGENVSAGQAIYLSSGSGGKTAGKWYKTDSTNAYSSSTAKEVGFAPSAVLAGASGFARVAGQITGLAGLTAGLVYYASNTPGGVTSTPPANPVILGVAVSTTTINVLSPFPLYGPVITGGGSWAGSPSIAAPAITGGGSWTGSPSLASPDFTALPTGVGAFVFSYPTANTTKNNNTTLVDIPGLSFAVLANKDYEFEFVIHCITPAGANLKLNLTGPAAPTALRYGATMTTGGAVGDTTDASAFGTNLVFTVTSAVDRMVVIKGLLRNGANAGTVQLQFAQNTLVVGDTIVYANSHVKATRVS